MHLNFLNTFSCFCFWCILFKRRLRLSNIWWMTFCTSVKEDLSCVSFKHLQPLYMLPSINENCNATHHYFDSSWTGIFDYISWFKLGKKSRFAKKLPYSRRRSTRYSDRLLDLSITIWYEICIKRWEDWMRKNWYIPHSGSVEHLVSCILINHSPSDISSFLESFHGCSVWFVSVASS